MWENTDRQLKEFNKEYLKVNQKSLDEIQSLFDTDKDLDEYASKSDLGRFQRRIESNMEYLSDYGKYEARKRLNKRRIRYRDMLWFDLFMIYAVKQYSMAIIESKLFNNIANDIYNTEIKGLKKDFKIPKKKLDLKSLVSGYLENPNSKGYIWQDYKDAMTTYNVNELFNQVIQNKRANKPLNINAPEFKTIISRQNKRYINVNGDKISGAIDNQSIYVANSVKIDTYIWCGVDKCEFIAVIDEATTPICEGLNGHIFNIKGWNKFYRYSGVDKKDVLYTVYGLQSGINLPPLDNYYHACRSTIEPIYKK